MEILLEIENIEAEKLGISANSKISLWELKKKLAGEKMKKLLEESHRLSKQHGLDNLSEDEINNVVNEAKENYKLASEKNSD